MTYFFSNDSYISWRPKRLTVERMDQYSGPRLAKQLIEETAVLSQYAAFVHQAKRHEPSSCTPPRLNVNKIKLISAGGLNLATSLSLFFYKVLVSQETALPHHSNLKVSYG